MLTAHSGDGVRHAPAVAVEHGQGVEVDLAVVDPALPSEHCGVEPEVAVGHFDPLGAGGGSAGVVDGGGGLFAGFPRLRSDVVVKECIGFWASSELVFYVEVAVLFSQLGVNDQHLGF